VIQLGTLVAVFVYFRIEIVRLLTIGLRDWCRGRFLQSPESRMLGLIALGTLPVVIVGLLGKKWLKTNFYDLTSMAIVTIAFALLMLAAEIWSRLRKSPALGEHQLGVRESVWIGLWQALALFPGASRSGTTITGGLFAGVDRSVAARFSFLLSLPTIFAAGMKELYDEYKLWKNPLSENRISLFASGDDVLALIVGTIVSAIVGYLAIAWLLKFLRTYSLAVFIGYRLLLGVVLLAFFCG
jgi:undecaprenyl-diphosphatase